MGTPNPLRDRFERQSVWLLLFLSLITGTINWAFWLRRQTRILNLYLPQQAIPDIFFPATLLLTVLDIGWGFVEASIHNDPGIILIGKVFTLADRIVTLVWIFKVRNRLHALLVRSTISRDWMEGLWTFLFGILYLQFKLNRMEYPSESESMERPPGMVPPPKPPEWDY